MTDFDTNFRIAEIEKGIHKIKESLDNLVIKTNNDDELWDSTDLLRNWHISERTLAGWRAEKKISFSKVGKKIFYSKKDRDSFIKRYHINGICDGTK